MVLFYARDYFGGADGRPAASAGQAGRPTLLLETELGLGTAEIDLFDLVDVPVFAGLASGLVELLFASLDFHGRREGLGAVDFGEDGVGAIDFQLVLAGFELETTRLGGAGQDDLVALGAYDGQTRQGQRGHYQEFLHERYFSPNPLRLNQLGMCASE